MSKMGVCRRLLISGFCFLLFLCKSNFVFAKNHYSSKSGHNFDGILLVVHYNHPHYESIQFIKTLYTDFPNIVFYGEKLYASNPNAVIQVETKIGFFFSRIVADALERFPNYRGYIFLQDDALMNFWNFTRFKKDKIWFGVSLYRAGPVPPSWRTDFDKSKVLREFYTAIPSTGGWHWGQPSGDAALMEALPHLEKSDQQMLEKNIGKDSKIGMVCDMFYLPGKFSKKALRISKVFRDVFCEISVPMTLACLDDFENWEYLRGHSNFPFGGGRYPQSGYREESDWIHPLKFSQQAARDFAQKVVEAHTKTQKN